jgi:ABC-2 type transport system ATP-binding protein
MIRVVDVTHHYGIRPVLKNINMEIKTGEVVVVVGPNGMGKTTLLGVLAGVLWPYSGYVEYGGERRRDSLEGERALRKQIAYLPDQSWLPKTRTGVNSFWQSAEFTALRICDCSITRIDYYSFSI